MVAKPVTTNGVVQLQATVVQGLLGVGVAVGFEFETDQTNAESDFGLNVFPEERPAIERASGKRAMEFAAGRACARAGLRALGHEPTAVPQGEDRSPQWPPGIEGSISHTDGKVMAVVARSRDLASGDPSCATGLGLGVDVEQRGRVHRQLYDKLFTPAEIETLRSLSEEDEAVQATVRFSAKEAFYKAQYRITAAWVSFTDVSLARSEDGRFTAEPASDLAALSQVAWPVAIGHVVDDSHVTTGVVVRSISAQG